MREGRNGTGETKLRADEISPQMGIGALERPGGIAVIGGESKGSQNFESATHFPAIEVEIPGGGSGHATGDYAGALRSLRVGYLWTHEGVTAKELNALSV
jgi:hypothetical protein